MYIYVAILSCMLFTYSTKNSVNNEYSCHMCQPALLLECVFIMKEFLNPFQSS